MRFEKGFLIANKKRLEISNRFIKLKLNVSCGNDICARAEDVFDNDIAKLCVRRDASFVNRLHALEKHFLRNGAVGLYRYNSAAQNGCGSGESTHGSCALGVCVYLAAFAGVTCYREYGFAVKLYLELTALGADNTC